MRNIIVGTAGHIDHGKTSLVKALTGTDADRLAEEKRRGITIDLGFAHLQLTKDLRLGFIDVPGHERFIKNMLAGAAGIDVVLFVIAADESIKPQTREHFEICRMLGVQAGVIALTKSDQTDPDLLELVRLEVDEFVAGSFLEHAPKVAVSSVTGTGLPELRIELERTARAVREKSSAGWFRLPIDRAFTMKGFGTVVTGTLVSGTLSREQEVELYPTGRRLRVRGVQVYGETATRARGGERTAVNLVDIEPAEIERGMVLSEAGRFNPVKIFDARLDLLPSAKPLKNHAPIHLHIGSAEIEAEIRYLDKRATLKPGASTWTRIALREPALILPGDRFIVRMFSPVSTIGGGVVADISGRKYRRGEDIPQRLTTLLEGDASVRTELLVAERPDGILQSELIALTGLSIQSARPWLIADARVAELKKQLTAKVRQFHKENTLLPGMPKQDLKNSLIPNAAPEVFNHILESAAPEVVQHGEVVRLASHRVILKLDEEQARATIEAAFLNAGLTTPAVQDVLKESGLEPARARSILQILQREGKLVRVSDELVLHTAACTSLREHLSARKGQRFAVPEFKEWTGVSRKYAIPLLEYLDREHVTRRDGAHRIVL
ncbi:MAG: selenocysteine-specific elongation factor [Bryobacterales bacterium]|jgi:selenocysteine-specific elongation factor|nr:selenocysteine-specific elongation factor [Bryobacterales bacterium]